MKPSGKTIIYLGADHAGFEMKEMLRIFLYEEGYEIVDCGNTQFEAEDDYPDFGFAVGRAVASNLESLGVVFCGSGVGMCLSANKVAGIRAGCALGEGHAQSGKRDDDTNVLCIASRSVSVEDAKKIILAWLGTKFEKNERFVRRVEKVARFEQSESIRSVKRFSKTKIVPAILEVHIEDAYKKLSAMEGLMDWIQIDVMDGKFVSGVSFDMNIFDIQKFPFFYEVHLMVSDPVAFVEICERRGMDRIIFHWESVHDIEKARELCENISKRGMSVGVAINPETPIEELKGLSACIDSVLILGVHPGASGQIMLPGTIDRIAQARKFFPHRVSIGIDGGVTKENVTQCISAGADRIAAGSMLFEAENPALVIREITG